MMERFDITFYEGPGADYVGKEEVIADMSACGMTLSQLWFTYDVETNIKALQLLEKYNMKAVVYEKRLLALYDSRKIEDVDSVVKAVVDDYKDYYHVITGWEIADEPNTEGFPILAKMVETTQITGLLKPYDYEVDTDELTTFSKSMIEYTSTARIALPTDSNDLYSYSPSDFRVVRLVKTKYASDRDSSDMTSNVLTMKSGGEYVYSAKEYFEGVSNYRENVLWKNFTNILK